MKPETLDYLAKAKRKLSEAHIMIKVGLFEDAARNSYLAGMNAARALLFEDGFQITKRHKQLFGALAEVLHNRGIHDSALTAFLPTVAHLKAIADYETGEGTITEDNTIKAIERAKQFIDKMIEIISTDKA